MPPTPAAPSFLVAPSSLCGSPVARPLESWRRRPSPAMGPRHRRVSGGDGV
ncbi:Os08g0486000 [Oryza sativa Japonica Group]|uniref:Os08g0486000 protein n=1 Tax=Oryza sativa subsp. japonica TaxID=39947 RepID=Q6ZDR9_ORYSJ|nr:unknown protein [Oryza sativa Japonica Group]BAF24006.1 Os08g0486000 [Oryza sativa Japonica Group]|eukprot:NP_001062092.1 Os08g0486000 [Oryza sativa Japonica Group]